MNRPLRWRWPSGWPSGWRPLSSVWLQEVGKGWHQLLARLPCRLREWLQAGPVEVVLVPEAGGWTLLSGDALQRQPLWGERLDPVLLHRELDRMLAGVDQLDRRLWLGLPADSGLLRDLQLPMAARGSLDRIAGFEIDRQTPFRPDQVYSDIREHAGPSRNRLQAWLAAAPCRRVDPWLEQLASLGLEVDGIDLLVAGGRGGFNLLPRDRRPRHPRPRRRLNILLAVVLSLLVLSAAAQWRHNRQAVLRQMQAEVAQQQERLQAWRILRREWQAQGRSAQLLDRQLRQRLPVLRVLDELSRRLPDDTSLQRLSIAADGQLSFVGLAPQATRLVELLKDARYLQATGLQGTIVREAPSGKERFAMISHLQRPVGARSP